MLCYKSWQGRDIVVTLGGPKESSTIALLRGKCKLASSRSVARHGCNQGLPTSSSDSCDDTALDPPPIFIADTVEAKNSQAFFGAARIHFA